MLTVTSAVLLFACKKDKPSSNDNTTNVTPTSGGTVYVGCEGNFLSSNSKVSFYTEGTGSVVSDLYQVTNGAGVGDVLQSMQNYGGKIYLVVNNSSKIQVCKPNTLQLETSITGFTSPRYILPVSNSKAYVTDLMANKVWKVDLTTNTISGSIALNGWCEQMQLVYGKVFVANYTTGKVYVIDSKSDVLIDSIVVSETAESMVQDANGKLWVLCNGNSFSSIAPAMYRINPVSKSVEQTFALTGYPSKLCANSSNDTLYFLNAGVYQFNCNASALPSTPLIDQGTSSFYGLSIHPESSKIFVGDAVDYISNGKVKMYKPNGTFTGSFTVGISPSSFLFH